MERPDCVYSQRVGEMSDQRTCRPLEQSHRRECAGFEPEWPAPPLHKETAWPLPHDFGRPRR